MSLAMSSTRAKVCEYFDALLVPDQRASARRLSGGNSYVPDGHRRRRGGGEQEAAHRQL